MGSIICDWWDLKTTASNYGWRLNARLLAAASQGPICSKQTETKQLLQQWIPLIKNQKCWPEVEKEEWRTEAPASKQFSIFLWNPADWRANEFLFSSDAFFATKSGRSSRAAAERCLQSAALVSAAHVSSRRGGKFHSPERKSRIMWLLLWCSHIPADAQQLTGTKTHTHTHTHKRKTVLRLVSWLHPVKNNDKCVKNCDEGRLRMSGWEARTWSETWPDVLMWSDSTQVGRSRLSLHLRCTSTQNKTRLPATSEKSRGTLII